MYANINTYIGESMQSFSLIAFVPNHKTTDNNRPRSPGRLLRSSLAFYYILCIIIYHENNVNKTFAIISFVNFILQLNFANVDGNVSKLH